MKKLDSYINNIDRSIDMDWGRDANTGQPSHGAHWRRFALKDGKYVVFDTAYDHSSDGYGNDPINDSHVLFVGSKSDSDSFLNDYFGYNQ